MGWLQKKLMVVSVVFGNANLEARLLSDYK